MGISPIIMKETFNFNDNNNFSAVTRKCFINKAVLNNFEKFKGKHVCHSLFNKLASLTLSKLGSCFSLNFAIF